MFTSKEIRNIWIDFFKSKGHVLEPSASLIPNNDPTLLWINAGVAALKKYFDGQEKPINPRIVNLQKCIRTNDIENVGNTARHHTFFEMAGNFSIGDYFKEEVIPWAFELLTSEKYFNIDKNLLYMTIYTKDDEAYDLWVKVGVDPSHILRLDTNFWEIGEGPCGPCTEIHFDRGEKYDKRGIELIQNEIENERYIEIWNIVFSTYNAKQGVKREDYKELPHKNIDTGCGLERLCCILQDAKTNYDTDLFMPIMNEITKKTNIKYEGQKEFKVIADHIRTLTFAIYDGAVLSNEGRGYVLRRVLRRALKHAKKLGINKPFLYELVDTVINIMSDFYPDLEQRSNIIKDIIKKEEEKFLETLSQGEKKVLEVINNLKEEEISGEIAFMLYDTYGFPFELTEEYASEYNKKVNKDEFIKMMNLQKERARNARNEIESFKSQNKEFMDYKEKSYFVGYDTFITNSKIIKKFNEGIVLDKTPFYATSGGQVCDKGTINNIEVTNVVKLPNGQFLHVLKEDLLEENMEVVAKIDVLNRNNTAKNHSATHLLQSALQKILGSHVHQQGSYVDSSILKFDFNNYDLVSDEKILEVEQLVNKFITEKHNITIKEMDINDAKKLGAMALFGEKYGSIVRVVDMECSLEFCGGTHVKNTSEINEFAILSYESIGSGTYRIVATTNNILKELENATETINNEINNISLKQDKIIKEAKNKNIILAKPNIIDDINIPSYKYVINKRNLLNNYKNETKILERNYQIELEKNALKDLKDFDKYIINNKLIARKDNIDVNILKQLADALLNKMGNGIVFLASVKEDKVYFVCKNNINLDSGSLVKKAAIITSGNGGGRKDMAQAGGKDITKVDLALEQIKEELL